MGEKAKSAGSRGPRRCPRGAAPGSSAPGPRFPVFPGVCHLPAAPRVSKCKECHLDPSFRQGSAGKSRRAPPVATRLPGPEVPRCASFLLAAAPQSLSCSATVRTHLEGSPRRPRRSHSLSFLPSTAGAKCIWHLLWDRYEAGATDSAWDSTDAGPASQSSGEKGEHEAMVTMTQECGEVWGQQTGRSSNPGSAIDHSMCLGPSQCIAVPQFLICKMGVRVVCTPSAAVKIKPCPGVFATPSLPVGTVAWVAASCG